MSSHELPADDSVDEAESTQLAPKFVGENSLNIGEDNDNSNDTETVTVARDKGLYRRSLHNALIAARCADEMRAQDVVVLDMTKIAAIVDFFVIGTGTSRRQMHAIADEVNRKLKGDGGNDRLGIEGYRTEANWILMDFGDVVLHVFTEEGRELYDLENLKADAKRIDWQSATPADG